MVLSGQSPPPSGSTSPQSVNPSLSLSLRSAQFVSFAPPALSTMSAQSISFLATFSQRQPMVLQPAPSQSGSSQSIFESPSLSTPSVQLPSAFISARHWQPDPQLSVLQSGSAQSILPSPS